ncbi:MAG: hypothetical protein IIY62_00485 [Kiritimatiellae bacterium]|nr:hypothetical protein [Kiritimatiellia bacterium]
MTNDGLSMVTKSIKFPQTLWERIVDYAARDDRSYSSVVRLALGRFFGVNRVKTRGKGRPSGAKSQKVRVI